MLTNPISTGFIVAMFLILMHKISYGFYSFISMFILITSAILSIFLILAHQNVESINESSPINKPQSSQRDSIVVQIIQSLMAIFLTSCIFINRLNKSDDVTISDEIFTAQADKSGDKVD